jgi:hypothetical protein
MPKLKVQDAEAGALTLSQEMLLLYGHDLLAGWQQSQERAAWLQTAEARAAWRRHRARLIREWLSTMPRELPAGSLLFETARERAQLMALMKAKWARFEKRKPAPPQAADAQ